ncbi:hypothetical protein RND81_02G016100 [Saponaria officinalis]|uniref:FAS1 domain-containing protein n=1 Tax=Saponaria officinalis TaxID=3572 RepID=A0AAW1MSQ8_SAPOF
MIKISLLKINNRYINCYAITEINRINYFTPTTSFILEKTSMASTLFFFSLLLLTATTTTATTTTTAAPPTPPPSLPPLPLPPPPPQDPVQESHFNTILDTIINAGDFRNWANLLAGVDPSVLPFSATIFVPGDSAFLDASLRSPQSTVLTFIDPLLFPYHIIPHRFVFSELRLFPSGARLPTLLAGKTLLVTNNSAVNFTIDGALISRPDLFQNGAVAVHGVGGVLDYTRFGDDGVDSPPPENNANHDNNDNDNVDVKDGGGGDGNMSSPVTESGVFGNGGNGVPAVVQASGGGNKSSLQWLWCCLFSSWRLILGIIV